MPFYGPKKYGDDDDDEQEEEEDDDDDDYEEYPYEYVTPCCPGHNTKLVLVASCMDIA